jgi:hypothetical protein
VAPELPTPESTPAPQQASADGGAETESPPALPTENATPVGETAAETPTPMSIDNAPENHAAATETIETPPSPTAVEATTPTP